MTMTDLYHFFDLTSEQAPVFAPHNVGVAQPDL